MLRDYTRIRLAKIEKYLFHLIKNDLSGLLSQSEFEFANHLFKLKRKYFSDNLYKKINPQLHDFGSSGISKEVVQGPPEKFYSMMKSNTNEANYISVKDIYLESNETLSIHKDDIVCLPYTLIKEKIEEKKYQLI
jgi:hypothetical protein